MKTFLMFVLFYSTLTAQWIDVSITTSPNLGNGWAIDALDDQTALASYGSVYLTENGGQSWVAILDNTNGEGDASDVVMLDQNKFRIVTMHGKIKLTDDAGSTWETVFYDSSKTEFMNYIEFFDDLNGVAMGDAVSGDSTNTPLFLHTTDGGYNWFEYGQNTLYKASSYRGKRPIDFVNKYLGYFIPFGPQKGIFKTLDGGLTWVKNEIKVNSGYGCVKFYDEHFGVAQLFTDEPSPGGMYTTNDGGSSWESGVGLGVVDHIAFVSNRPNEVFVLSNAGVNFSSDSGKTFSGIEEFAEYDPSDMVFTDENTAWILFGKGIIYKITNYSGITSVVEDGLPEPYQLSQNYPNPFNPTTIISYSLPEQTRVTIKIYDIIGKEVKTLVNTTKNAGDYTESFNGGNLSSGIYFYTLKTNKFVETKKMILLK